MFDFLATEMGTRGLSGFRVVGLRPYCLFSINPSSLVTAERSFSLHSVTASLSKGLKIYQEDFISMII